jgi:hypothetical protein
VGLVRRRILPLYRAVYLTIINGTRDVRRTLRGSIEQTRVGLDLQDLQVCGTALRLPGEEHLFAVGTPFLLGNFVSVPIFVRLFSCR